MSSNPVAAANDNYKATFVGLADLVSGGETRQFGQITAPSAGLPVPEYNRIFAFDPPPHDELEAAVSWLKRREVSFWVTITPPVVETVEGFPTDFALVKSHEQPGMVLASLAEIPPRTPLANVSTVADEDALDEFVTVFSSVFGRSADVTAQAYRPLVSEAEVRLFVGRVDNQAVACGVLSQSDTVAGVYAIGVVEEFRRRGLGEFMTWEVLRAGQEAGCRVGVLQSSEMGQPLYEQMGFETVVTYHHFEPTT